MNNIIGKKYGKLEVISRHSTTRNGHIRYTCKCECNKEHNVLSTHLIQGNTTSCGCDRKSNYKHSRWNGIGEISGGYWYDHIIRNANESKGRRKLELSITKEYVWNLFILQNKKCALSNLELTFPRISTDKSYTASLDRIDSDKGYIEGNVQWVHKDVNLMKNKLDQDYFIQMCKKIAGGQCEV